MKPSPLGALEKAVEIVGSQAELARRLAKARKNPRIKQAHIWNWLNRDFKVPDWAVLSIEDITNVSRHELRPDLYPRERVIA